LTWYIQRSEEIAVKVVTVFCQYFFMIAPIVFGDYTDSILILPIVRAGTKLLRRKDK